MPLKVLIKAYGIDAPVTCDGETIVVNLHGALISTAIRLNMGMIIDLHVYLTGKRAIAKVAYVDPVEPLHCGIELAKPQNIWVYRCRRMTGKKTIYIHDSKGASPMLP